MPFIRVTLDSNGQAGRTVDNRTHVFIVNDSGNNLTIIDGASNFTLNNNAMAQWTAEQGMIAFAGTAGNTFLFGWGDFRLDPVPPTSSVSITGQPVGIKIDQTSPNFRIRGQNADAGAGGIDEIIQGLNAFTATVGADVAIGASNGTIIIPLVADASGFLKVNLATSSGLQIGLGNAVSTQAGGSATAPAAGATIVSIATNAITYNVWVTAGLVLGVPVAGDVANMTLFKNAASISVLAVSTSPGRFGPFRIAGFASGTFTVKVGGNAGTANVVYYASIVAVPVP